MKQKSKIIASSLLGLGAVALVLGAAPVGFAKGSARGAATKSATVIVSLTDAEKADLMFMREEEKVARDVYLFLYDVWGEVIFSNVLVKDGKPYWMGMGSVPHAHATDRYAYKSQ